MEPFVDLRNVSAWRGNTQVFDGLTLRLERGESAVILGPNGAGKSTLLKLLTREIHPAYRPGTEMRLFGKERWNLWELRKRMGLLSHDLQVGYPREATGLDVVMSGFHSSLGLWDHQERTEEEQERARATLARLHAQPLEDRPYATFSTGEQRRVLLGRALVHEPELLILDEPTSGLDPRSCFQYLHLLRTLLREGTAVLLVTHHLHEIPPEVERTLLIGGGRVLADGPKGELLTRDWMSRLFDFPIEVVESGGFYHAFPGEASLAESTTP